MKTNRIYYFAICIVALFSVRCTDLSETPYNLVATDAFYKTEQNVIQSFVRSFEHAYWTTARSNNYAGESTADHIVTPRRDGSHFYDGGIFYRMHYHTWTIDDSVIRGWTDMLQGIAYLNAFMYDMENLFDMNPNLKVEESLIDNLVAQSRGLRAWYYLRLLDQFRNVPIVTSFGGAEMPTQNTPKETFDFIESEIKAIMPNLTKKTGTAGNDSAQGVWNQASAAMTLMRLYLNAQQWIGEDRFADCATVCQDIINGTYGHYEIDERWDAPFDWDNQNSKEVIYAFTSTYGGTRHNYTAEGIGLEIGPFNGAQFFASEFLVYPRFSLSPSLDVDGTPFPYELGRPVAKFKNYPDDVRLKRYTNLGNSRREGMFLHGYLENNKAGSGWVKSWGGEYDLYIRDQVGIFRDTDPNSVTPNPSGNTDGRYDTPASTLAYADESSGWFLVKYPVYPIGDAGAYEADYVVFRLPEVYYTLAEIKWRQGDSAEAERLMNLVRKRNYPEGSPSLYPEDGSKMTELEMLDEWGREFIGEALRRTILCRFGRFGDAWWDKPADTSDHLTIFPIDRRSLQANPKLVQNPDYPGIN